MHTYQPISRTGLMSINELTKSQQRISSSMEALSTGLISGTPLEEPGYIGKLSDLKSQILSTLAASRNAADSLAMLDSADAVLDETSDLLTRIKEIATQASSEAITDTTRAALKEEKGQLAQAIDSFSSSTKWNDRRLLDGSFNDIYVQAGIGGGDGFGISLGTVKTDSLGSYISQGPTRAALSAAASAAANTTTDSENITITAQGASTTYDVAANDSAEAGVTKINATSSVTGVSASARTYGLVFSTNASTETYSLLINGTATSNFTISSSNVSDAVTKVNLVSATTGVSAIATTDNKVLLTDSQGGDITIENEASGTSLDVQAVQTDGTTTQGSAISLAADDSNDATRLIGAIRLFSDNPFSVNQAGTSSLGYATTASASLQSISGLDFGSADASADAIAVVDSALNQIASLRGSVGAYMSRLEFTYSLLLRSNESKELARSNIEDTNFAIESAKLAKAMILRSVNSELLKQSNQNESLVLQLIS